MLGTGYPGAGIHSQLEVRWEGRVLCGLPQNRPVALMPELPGTTKEGRDLRMNYGLVESGSVLSLAG